MAEWSSRSSKTTKSRSRALPSPYDKLSHAELTAIIDHLLLVNDLSKPSLTHCIKELDILRLIETARPILLQQPMLLEIMPPVQVCGDIHGQYPDLLRMFNKVGWPHQKSFLFLGDYVDRGSQQLETILLLTAYKAALPETFFMLRGNHECENINRVYGFYDEVKRRYSDRVFHSFQRLFNVLPLAALIGSRILCMHGGLSPEMTTENFSWTTLRNIARPMEPEDRGLVTDLLWSDPDEKATGWHENDRGISVIFGENIVRQFCEDMEIDLIARGHQVVMDGYQFFADRHLVTIFSAPKYCGEFDNNAATMYVDEEMSCTFKILKPVTTNVSVKKSKGRRLSGPGSMRAIRRRQILPQ